MNKVLLVGRLVRDPELRQTSNNIPVAQFSIAVNRAYTPKDGERQADFINCVAWRAQAENLAKYMKKGSMIGVEGQIQTRNYEDQGGVKRYITEVVCDSIEFLESKSATRSSDFERFDDINPYNTPKTTEAKKPQQEDPFKDIGGDFDITNDDLPF
jgi:single-strand DNA-binding protein